MTSPFVQPSIERLHVKGTSEWIDVHRELTFGQQQDMLARMRKQFGLGEPPVLDTTRIGRARMEAYIVGWSFTDPQGKPVAVTPAALDNLSVHMARDIRDLLEAHEQKVVDEYEAEKNAPDGASASSPISPSVK